MKIFHTSDWHLGKKLYGKSRLNEQAAALDEIDAKAVSLGADVVVVAGDVFDTSVPAAEAEELFYSALVKLSEHCVPVVIAGNHDDESRLFAPSALAWRKGIVLADGSSRKCDGEYGGKRTKLDYSDGRLIVERGGERLDMRLLSYPAAAKLMDVAGKEDYCSAVAGMIRRACEGFEEGGNNMFASHLFVTGAENALTDERELGGSKLLPRSAVEIPRCGYVALGHIHKPLCVSRETNAYYSGSILQYDFSDASGKRVVAVDMKGGKVSISDVAIEAGRRLVTVRATGADEALLALDEHENDYVTVEYDSDEPLAASAVAAMKKRECFVAVDVKRHAASPAFVAREKLSDEELFELFYASKKGGAKPKPRLTQLFLGALNGEETP